MNDILKNTETGKIYFLWSIVSAFFFVHVIFNIYKQNINIYLNYCFQHLDQLWKMVRKIKLY